MDNFWTFGISLWKDTAQYEINIYLNCGWSLGGRDNVSLYHSLGQPMGEKEVTVALHCKGWPRAPQMGLSRKSQDRVSQWSLLFLYIKEVSEVTRLVCKCWQNNSLCLYQTLIRTPRPVLCSGQGSLLSFCFSLSPLSTQQFSFRGKVQGGKERPILHSVSYCKGVILTKLPIASILCH